MDKLPKDRSSSEERSFRNPPLWIHVSQAGEWLLSRREARKRAIIRVLDRVENRSPGQTPRAKTGA